MDKRGILLFIAISILILITGCSSKENSITSPEVKVQNVDLERELSEKEVLNEYLELIEPILDNSIFYEINQFAGNIVNWAATKNDNSIKEAKSYHEEITIVLTKIIDNEVVSGYGIQTEWKLLSAKCSSIKTNLNRILLAVEDNDAGNALSDKSIYDNTEILKIALVIQNKIQQELNNLEIAEIEPIISEKLAFEKALRYAKYLYSRDNVTIERQSDYETINTIGKHYNFIVVEDVKTSILINVETSGIVLYRDNSYEFVPDAVLPALEGETSMPNLIGLKKDEAVNLLDSLGLDYQIAFIVDESSEMGTVKRSTPEAGKAIFDDTNITLIVVMQSGDESNEFINKEEALNILEAKINLLDRQYFGDGSVRDIDGREYYLFTINNEITVDGAYCIDIITGELFYCEEDLTLMPISTN
jgi:hypothetical protein